MYTIAELAVMLGGNPASLRQTITRAGKDGPQPAIRHGKTSVVNRYTKNSVIDWWRAKHGNPRHP